MKFNFRYIYWMDKTMHKCLPSAICRINSPVGQLQLTTCQDGVHSLRYLNACNNVKQLVCVLYNEQLKCSL